MARLKNPGPGNTSGGFDMWGSLVGGALGAATSLFGSNKSAKSQQKANEMNMQLAREQMAYQKELAQSQIQWRVEDAKKAGLHPMAALGLSPMSYSPVSGSAVGSTYDYSGVGNSLQQMGQNIDAHVMNAKTREERKQAQDLQNKQIGLSLRSQELNNQILEQELISRRVKLFQQLTPGLPGTKGLPRGKYAVSGQGDSVMPRQEGTVATGDKKFQFMQQPNGTYSLEPGNDWAQTYEDKLLLEWWPIIKTQLTELDARAYGKTIDGMRYNERLEGWVPDKTPDKRSAASRILEWFNLPWYKKLMTTRMR
uniref:DNA pilot protein n=2 Tax=Dulem virus 92 TaxID=3145803 RepID=A0AAU8AZ23_9VIRU